MVLDATTKAADTTGVSVSIAKHMICHLVCLGGSIAILQGSPHAIDPFLCVFGT